MKSPVAIITIPVINLALVLCVVVVVRKVKGGVP